MERVVLSRLDEFIPHYLVKVICSFAEAGQGSGELFDQIIARVLPAIIQTSSTELQDFYGSGVPKSHQYSMKYSDMIRFFEVYPDVTYIYESTMTEELYGAFLTKLSTVIEDKKMPIEDVCRAFNILVRMSPYSGFDDQRTFQKLLARLRHSLHAVPKDYFMNTLVQLMELQ